MLLRPGTRLAGRYEVVGEQGGGPAFRAYHGLDHDVEVEVVLWAIREELLPDEAWRRRFCAAVLRTRALGHPQLRKIFEVGIHEGGCFVALAPGAGVPLTAHLGEATRLAPAELRHLGGAVADVLAAAHAGGFVHGFLHPDDIAVDGGEPKLSGLGLWAHLEPIATRAAFAAAGRPVAPELARGEPPAPARVVWGLALLLAELTLATPVPDATPAGVADLITRLELEAPALSAALAAGLAEEPALRPDDPLLLLHKLGALDDLATPTLETHGRAVTIGSLEDAPTRHYPKIAEDDGVVPDPDFPDDEPAEPPRGTAIIRPPRTPWRPGPGASGAPAQVPTPSPTPLPASGRVPEPPLRAATPGPVSPRAPTHRPASRVLPAAPPPPLSGALTALRGISLRHWLGALSIVAAGVFGIAVAVARSNGERDRVREPTVEALHPAGDGGPPGVEQGGGAGAASGDGGVGARPLEPCPPGMRVASGPPSFCIDAFEAPGEGFTPATSVTLAQARRACSDRGKRLCSAAEWESACRGPDGASYPYGDRYAEGRCNLRGGKHAALVPSGTFKECVSAAGVFDMSGNAAEWVEETQVRGSSAGDGRDGRCSRADKRGPERASADVGYRCCAAAGAF